MARGRGYAKIISRSKKLILILFAIGITGLLIANYDGWDGLEHRIEPEVLSAVPVVLEQREADVIDLTNQYRSENKLSQLKTDNGLVDSAREKASDLCNNNYWSHDRPDGTPFYEVIRKHNDYKNAGENLAKGFSSAEEAMVGWKNSPTHNENLLDAKWEYIGVGFVHCGTGVSYYVQHFKNV